MSRKTHSPGRQLVAGVIILTQLFWLPDSLAASYYWDADQDTSNNTLPGTGLGGTGNWDLGVANWWDGANPGSVLWTNGTADLAVFSGAPGTVTLQTAPITVGGLVADQTVVRLEGGELVLGTSGFNTSLSSILTVDSLISGTLGLTKTGRGTVILSNGSNNYVGITSVTNGTLAITSQGALGAEDSRVTVTGSTSVGAIGGNLTLLSGWESTLNFTRDLNLAGGGTNNTGAALSTLGNVLLTGDVQVSPGGTADTRITSNFGTLQISGSLTLSETTARNLYIQGAGNVVIDSQVTGVGAFLKSVSIGGMELTNNNNTFTGNVRIDNGSLRVAHGGALGLSTANGALTIGGSTGAIELRTDDPDTFSSRRLTMSTGGTGTFFVDHSVHGTGLNETVTLSALTLTAGSSTRTMNLNGRNGYGITFTGDSIGGALGGSNNITVNANGPITFGGDFWNNTSTTARTLTMTVNTGSQASIQGSLIASGAAHLFTKSGAGVLTILGNNSTYTGATTITAGTLAISSFGSINNNSAVINIGATTAAGVTLSVIGNDLTAGQATTTKPINLAGTTGGATILANQTGASAPLWLQSDFTALGVGSKALTLGGTSHLSINNEISGVIVDNAAANMTSVVKTGSNTWVLSGANTFTGATLINNGLLKLRDTSAGTSRNVLLDTVPVGFAIAPPAVGTAGGTLEYIGSPDAASVEQLGSLVAGAGAGTIQVTAGNNGTASLVFSSLNTVPSTTLTAAIGTSSTTTLTVASTAGLIPGMRVEGITGAATYIVSITNGTQFVVSASQTNKAIGTPLTFSRLNGGGTLNFAPDANSTVTIGNVGTAGFLNGYSYFRGADFAYAPTITDAVLRAPLYGTDPGFVTSSGGTNVMSDISHYELTGPVTDQAARTINSLKISGSQSLGLTGVLTVNNGAGTEGGILVTGGSATISGSSVTSGGAAELVIRVDGVSDVLTLSSTVASSTTGGLTKTGAGTLIIGGANAHTTGGFTNLHEGTIQLTTGGRLSANSVNFFMRQGTVLDLNGISTSTSATAASIGAFNGAGTVTNSSATPTVFAVGGGSSGGTGTFAGTIDETNGQISVIKMGTSNSQTWTGISNYTGSTTIGVPGTGTTGVLTVTNLADIGVASSIGRGDATDDGTNAASLIFGGTTGGLSYNGNSSLSINRLFTLAGTAAGAGARFGAASPNHATLIWNQTVPIIFASGNTAAQTLTFSGASLGDNRFNLQIIDNPNGGAATSVSKIDGGLWILGHSGNSYTGTTTIAAGALRAVDGASLPSTTALILGGGVLETFGTFDRDLAATATIGDVTWTAGGGFAASTAPLLVAIGGEATPTPLTWGSDGFMTSGNLLLSSFTAMYGVEMVNGIDLNGAVRTITINDNPNTAFDVATLSGVISGSGTSGITKNGNAVLQLLGRNTYEGATTVSAGSLIVKSIGGSGIAESSLGAGTGVLNLGSGSSTTSLYYVGPGETSDRQINMAGTTGGAVIDASGSGPLSLSRITLTGTGNKTLTLQGQNTDANEISADLANNGTLAVSKTGGGTWILSGNNSGMSGNVTAAAGALGIGHDNSLGTGTLVLSNVSIFAAYGDRTIANNVTHNNNTVAGFIGDYGLSFTGNLTFGSTTSNPSTTTNNIASGKTLSFNTVTANSITATRTWTINGSGNTVINGDITTTTAFGLGISYTGNGTLQLNGANTTPGGTTISNAAARVTISSSNALGSGTLGLTTGTLISNGSDLVIPNNVTHSGTFTLAGPDKFTFDGTWLNNTGSRTINVNSTGGAEFAGQINLSEHATSARTLTISGTGDVLISGKITNGIGTGASALNYTGSGTLTLTNADNSYTGTTTLNNAAATLRLTGSGKLSTGNLTVTAGTLRIESVDQTVATLTMGNSTGNSALIDVASGLTLTPSAITFSGTGTLAATITGDGTLHLGTEMTVSVADNVAETSDMVWDIANLTGSGTLTKTGNGTLDLSGIANNDFTGNYQINAGSILGLDLVANNIALDGGVYSGTGTFTRALGTGDNQAQWLAGGGGFAAVGGDLTVTLGGAPNPLVWGGTTNFVPDAAPLLFGSTGATGVTDFTPDIDLNGASRTVSVIDNASLTTDWAELSGILSGAGGGLTKTGNGILRLTGDNTFTGEITVTTGTLQFSTVSDNGGAASNLGQGTDGITLSGGRLQFIGAGNESTNRAITFTTTGILDASGTGTITFDGLISPGNFSLNLEGSGNGILNSSVSHTGTTGDLNKNGSGTWTINTALGIGDNLVISGGTLIFNAPDTFGVGTGDDLFIRAAKLILGVDGAITSAMDDLNISTETATGGILEINGTTGSASTDLLIGTNPANQGTVAPMEGQVMDSIGGGSFSSGTLTLRNGEVSAELSITGSSNVGNVIAADHGGHNTTAGIISGDFNAGSSLVLWNGEISGDITLATGTTAKHSSNTFTLSGNNTVAGAGVTTISNGILQLNYGVNTGTKISAAGLNMNGGMLRVNGHAATAVTVAAGNLTLGTASDPAPAVIQINTAGADVTVQVGNITRNVGSTLRFHPSTAGGRLTTSATNGASAILGGWATYQLGSGSLQFATISGGELIGFDSTIINSLGAWTAGADITDSTGFTGALGANLSINSLRFDAASGLSAVAVGAGNTLDIVSGGILVTPSVTGGTPAITGGRLSAGTFNELVVTHEGSAPFTITSRLNGTLALTKAGSGLMILDNAANYSTGTVRLTGGTLRTEGGGAIGDRTPVVLEPVAGVVLHVADSETIGTLSGGDSSNTRNMAISIDAGQTLTINQNANGTYYSHISASSGSVTLNKWGTGTLTVTDGLINLGTGGVLNVNQGRFTVDVNGNNSFIHSVAAGTTVNIGTGASFFIEHNDVTTGSGIAGGRIADDVAFNLHSTGSTTDGLYYRNDENISVAELVGAVTLGSGVNSIRVDANTSTANTSQLAVLRAGSISRTNQATLVLRGNSIQASSNPRAQFQNASAMAAFGTGTGTSLPVIPWAIAPSSGGAGAPDTFLTTTGTANAVWRPMNLSTEFTTVSDSSGWTGVGGTVNVLLDTTVTGVDGNKTVRSLLVSTGVGAVDLNGDDTGTLTVDSGGFLFSGSGSSAISGFTSIGVNSALNEYVIHVVANAATIHSPINQSGAKLTKSGPGILTLTANNTGLSDVTINEGTLQIADLDNLGGNSGKTIFAGGTLRLDPLSYLGDDLSDRGMVFLSGGGTIDTNGNDIAFASSIGAASNGGLTKTGNGTLTLNAPVVYAGTTGVAGGTLRFGVSQALPATMNLNMANGVLDLGGFTTTLAGLNVAGNGTITGTAPLIFTGPVTNDGNRTLTLDNPSLTSFQGDVFNLVGVGSTALTLTINNNGPVEILGEVINGSATGGFTKTGVGTLTMQGANAYTGITTIDQGTLVFAVDQNLAGDLRFGSANTLTTTGTLDLSNANATFGGVLTIQPNTTDAATIIIGTGKTLTINNNVVIGSSGANSTTVAEFTGGGSLVVNRAAAGGAFAVGGNVSTGNKATADLSGLSSLSISLNTIDGIVRVNPNNGTNVTDKYSILILPSTGSGTSTITAATLAVGDSAQNNDTVAPFEQTNQLRLGSGLNTIQVNTVNIGTGTRDAGSITFNTGTGSLMLRNAAGAGPVTFNMGTGSSTTGAGASNVFDVTGHSADLLFGAVNIGTQLNRGGAMTNLFSFDQGTLVMASLSLSSRNTAGGTTSEFNIGGGSVTSGPVTMATAASAAGVAAASLNITGGTVNLTGDILKGGGAGTATASFTFNGANAVLDMNGHLLGGSGQAALDQVTIGAGTIRNLGEFNGGAQLVKNAGGTLTFDGTNTYTGGTSIEDGLVIAVGGASNRLSTGPLNLGADAASAVLQLGTAAGASSQTVSALMTSGTGSDNAIVSGNASYSTLTVNQSSDTTFAGAIGGTGLNQNNLHLIKGGAGELVIAGARTYTGSTSVLGGKLFIDGASGPLSITQGLTLADNTEFALRNSSSSTNVVYGFSGTGTVATIGGGVGATLGFALDGGFNTQIRLTAGQKMAVNGALTTAVYVKSAPVAGQAYVLIDGADDNSIFGSGTFNINPVVFNGGSFTYALSQLTAGTGEKWILTPTAQAAAADVWWKGDLTGIAEGVWSASLTTGPGFPTNWDDSQSGGSDALVPPDSGSIVHFSATGAANFATTLGADLTIQELIFHPGATAISVGSSGGTNTLTLGNTVNPSGITIMAGAANVSFSANIALAQAQTWNIADASKTFTLSGNLNGVGPLTLNGIGANAGTFIFTGPNGLASHTGGTSLLGGRLILEGGADNRLPASEPFILGNDGNAAILQLGDSVNGASHTTVGGLSSGLASGIAIVGGSSDVSTLTVAQTGTSSFHGVIGGAGTNQNNVALTKQGAGTLILNALNTYTGATTVENGTLQMGPLGSFSTALIINAQAGATATLDINGRPITLTGSLTLGGADSTAFPRITDSAGGGLLTLGGNLIYDFTNDPLGAQVSANLHLGATRTFIANDSATAAMDLSISGAITTTPGANGVGLILDGIGSGALEGAVTLSSGSTDGASADLTKNGTGSWTIRNAATVGDDYLINAGSITVEGAGSLTFNVANTGSPDIVLDSAGAPILNLNVANAVIGNSGTNRLFARDGSTIIINADGALGASIEQIILGDNSQGIGNLILNANASVPLLQVGFDSTGEIGNVTGTGTLSGLTTLNLYNGMVSANLAGAAANITKDTTLTVTLSGNNDLGTGNTLVKEGTLLLDFETHNGANSKIGTGNLSLGSTTVAELPAVLRINGNAPASTLQTVGDLTSVGGPVEINLISNGGQATVLRVSGLLSRTNGTLNLNAPAAETWIEYTGASTNLNGIVGGWMTVNNNDFATISGGRLVAASYTSQNDVALWGVNGNITNSAGFNGIVDAECNAINSLRFDAAAGSTVTIAESLMVTSGGIMVTSNVGVNPSIITGGSLYAGSSGFIFHQHNSASTLTVASNILGGGAITKNGNGILALSGSNITGTVNIDEGLLRVSGGSAISDNSAVNIRNSPGAGLEIVAGAGNSEEIGSLSGGGSGTQVLIGAGAVLTLNQTSSASFVGAFNGAGTLVKNGFGILTVSGNAAMTGPLIINQGRITMNGGSGALDSNSSITLNGAELLDLQDQSASENRLGDSSPITLHNTGGTGGLWIQRTGFDSLATDNVGAITIGAGHNVITAEAGTGTGTGNSSLADLVANTISRTEANHSTLLVRGLNLGVTTSGARRGFIRFDAGGQTAVNGYEVGGGGAAGAKNISIIPWMIGDATSAGLGNSFVTNIDGTTGLRPLAASEYTTNAAGFNGLAAGVASDHNIRFDADAALTGTATAINSLVIDSATGRSVTGPASALQITSGALLAAGGGNHTFGGFSEITTGGGRDYTVYVTASAAQNLTISSALTSTVPLVKSGAGILTLTNSSNAFSELFLNQGLVAVDSGDKLGIGMLNFFGGGIKLAAGFTGDISAKTWNISTGGGILDVSAVTGGAVLANGFNDSTPGTGGMMTIVTRGSSSTGMLTIQGASTFTGTVLFANGSVNSGNTNSVILQGDTNATLAGDVAIGNLINISNNFDVVVALGADEQIADTATITFRGASGENAYFKLRGFTETIAGIIDTTANGVIENRESDTVTAGGALALNSDLNFSYNGYMRDSSAGTADPNPLSLSKGGFGTQTLIGANIRHSGNTIIAGGALLLQDVTNWQSPIINNASLILHQTTNPRTHATQISGGGNLTKTGNGVLTLGASNTYSGMTIIEQGTVSFSTSDNLGDGSNTNHVRISNNAILQSTGANVDLGSDRQIQVTGAGGVIEVTGTNILTVSGQVIGDCAPFTKAGGGLLILATNNSYQSPTFVAGGVLQSGINGLGQTGLGPITVSDGGALAGTGATVGGALTVESGGFLLVGDVTTPGASALATLTAQSTLTLTEPVTLGAGSTVVLDITGATNAGSVDPLFGGNNLGSPEYNDYVLAAAVGAGQHDRLVFQDGALVNPTIETGTTFLINPVSFNAELGMIFNLADWAGITGFNVGPLYRDGSADQAGFGIDLPDISGTGNMWDLTLWQSHGVVTIVPEPSRALLFLFGLLSLTLRRRRKAR